jgi:hypothetical protein
MAETIPVSILRILPIYKKSKLRKTKNPFKGILCLLFRIMIYGIIILMANYRR